MDEDNLTKVHIDLPNHWAIGGESLWAKALGDDLYQIDNVPFFAYGLNYQDIVRATADSPDLKPEVREVVTPSGHCTFRVIFDGTTERDDQASLLAFLENYGASYERADGINVAIDLEPDGDYDGLFDKLQEYENSGHLSFETCEARVEGGFDDVPDDEQEA